MLSWTKFRVGGVTNASIPNITTGRSARRYMRMARLPKKFSASRARRSNEPDETRATREGIELGRCCRRCLRLNSFGFGSARFQSMIWDLKFRSSISNPQSEILIRCRSNIDKQRSCHHQPAQSTRCLFHPQPLCGSAKGGTRLPGAS